MKLLREKRLRIQFVHDRSILQHTSSQIQLIPVEGILVVSVVLVASQTLNLCGVIATGLHWWLDDKPLTNGCTFVVFLVSQHQFFLKDIMYLEDRSKLTGHSK